MDKTQVELLRGYLEKGRGKLRVARDLVQRGEWDDAVSRAYYDEETARRAVEEAEGFVEAVGAYIARLLPGTPEE